MSTDCAGFRILLVDDSDDDRLLFKAAFTKSGLSGQIVEKEDGNEAIEFLSEIATGEQTEWPDAIFLDLKMPGKNGFEVLQWIKDRPPLQILKTYILSGSQEPSDVQRARELGALDYIVKPIKSEEFRDLFPAAVASQ
jgi:CheY-like chemotaxis protein